MTADVTSYTELIGSINAEVQRLAMRSIDFDELCGFAPGLWGKVSGLLQVKRLGPEKLFDALRGAGLKIRIEVDQEQQAKMVKRIAENFNPRQANQARPGHASSPASSAVLSRVFKPLARKGGKARWAKSSKKDRSAHMRMMVMARETKRRERKRRNAAHRKRQRSKDTEISAAPVM